MFADWLVFQVIGDSRCDGGNAPIEFKRQAVQSLCDRVLLLEEGHVVRQGPTRQVVTSYLSASQRGTGVREWPRDKAPQKDGVARIAIRPMSCDGVCASLFESDTDTYAELDFNLTHIPAGTFFVGFDLFDLEGITVFRTYQADAPHTEWLQPRTGQNVWHCHLPKGFLNQGSFYVSPRLSIHNIAWLIHEDAVIHFVVRLRHGKSPLWDTLEGGRPGQIAPILDWSERKGGAAGKKRQAEQSLRSGRCE